LRPRARAAASPAAVRSRMRSRSNSAKAAKTWKTSLPPGVVVSIASSKLRNLTPWSARPVIVSTRWRRERPRRSSLPDDQGVAGPELVEDLGEDGPVGAGAAGGLGEHPMAAGSGEGVDLELEVLVGGGDAGVAKQVSPALERPTTP
jgi:hypothetical protein